jgi:hypothetical protein
LGSVAEIIFTFPTQLMSRLFYRLSFFTKESSDDEKVKGHIRKPHFQEKKRRFAAFLVIWKNQMPVIQRKKAPD